MKYLDADRLKAGIKRLQQQNDTSEDKDYPQYELEVACGYDMACDEILRLIDSLQQEQPEVQNGKFVFPKYLYARTKDNKTIDMSYAPQDMTAIEYIRNDFVQQYYPENKEKIMNFFDAIGDCGFSQHDILQLKNIWKEAGCPPPKSQVADASKMELPEVVLTDDASFTKELKRFLSDTGNEKKRGGVILPIIKHFYGLRNRALEESARHVYESWMGGTMDDVRRDMVELGTVLNARKEDK